MSLGWLGPLLEFGSKLIAFFTGKRELANQPEIKANENAAAQQRVTDDIHRTTDQAMHGKSQPERDEALERARQQDAE